MLRLNDCPVNCRLSNKFTNERFEAIHEEINDKQDGGFQVHLGHKKCGLLNLI